MLSHDNIVYSVVMSLNTLDIRPNEEVFVSYLPLNHIAAQITELWVPMVAQVRKAHFLARFSSLLQRHPGYPTKGFG